MFLRAERKVFGLLTRQPEAIALYTQAARRWLAIRATMEAHEYKLPAALFEDVGRVSPDEAKDALR